MILDIRIVLVRTAYSSNIGATARAAANMGVDQLILINPVADINSKARQGAAGAQTVLENIKIYKGWDDFFKTEGNGVRIALSRRGGKKRKVTPLEETLKEIVSEEKNNTESKYPLYLFLGPEADGLNVDDLAYMNHCCHLPTFGEFASMNLAQAALLALFVLRQQIPPESIPKQITGKYNEEAMPLYFPDSAVRRWLSAMGFDISARKSSAYLTLKRLFLIHRPSQHEVQVINAILEQNVRKLEELSRLLSKDLTD